MSIFVFYRIIDKIMIKKKFEYFYILTRKNLKRLILLFFLMIISIFFDVLSIGTLFPFINELIGNNSYSFNFLKYEIIGNFFGTNNKLLILSLIVMIFFILKNIFLFKKLYFKRVLIFFK